MRTDTLMVASTRHAVAAGIAICLCMSGNAFAMDCSIKNACEPSPITIKDYGANGCKFRWPTGSYVVLNKDSLALRWKLDPIDKSIKYSWGLQNGITLKTSPDGDPNPLPDNIRSEDLDGEGVEGVDNNVFRWLAVHRNAIEKRFELEFVILRNSTTKCTLMEPSDIYSITLK